MNAAQRKCDRRASMAIDILEQMRVAFRTEAQDLLIELDSALLALEEQPLDSSLVNRVFRAIHTIKGLGATGRFYPPREVRAQDGRGL